MGGRNDYVENHNLFYNGSYFCMISSMLGTGNWVDLISSLAKVEPRTNMKKKRLRKIIDTTSSQV